LIRTKGLPTAAVQKLYKRSATAVRRRLDRHGRRRPDHQARRRLPALLHPLRPVRRAALPAVRLALLLEPALRLARHQRY